MHEDNCEETPNGKKDKKDKKEKAGTPKSKKDQKAGTPKTTKKQGGPGKKEKKKDESDSKKRKAPWKSSRAAKTRMLVDVPACMASGSQAAEVDQKEWEPLFHNEYHPVLWAQVWSEWGARGAVVFTPACGSCAVQAVNDEYRVLLLALNEQHAEMLTYMVDCGIATAIQVCLKRKRCRGRLFRTCASLWFACVATFGRAVWARGQDRWGTC